MTEKDQLLVVGDINGCFNETESSLGGNYIAFHALGSRNVHLATGLSQPPKGPIFFDYKHYDKWSRDLSFVYQPLYLVADYLPIWGIPFPMQLSELLSFISSDHLLGFLYIILSIQPQTSFS